MKLKSTILFLSLLAMVGCATAGKQSEDMTDPVDEADDVGTAQGVTSKPAQPSGPVPKDIAEARPAKYVDKKYIPLSNALRSGQHEAVVSEASKILASNANDAVALNTIAMSLYRQGRSGAAKILLSKAFEANPKEASLLNNLALIQVTEGETSDAMLTLKRAYRLNDRNPEIQGNLGSLYVQGGDFNRALPLLEAAFRANNSSPSIANNYAIALRATKNYDRAEKIYKGLIEKNSRDVNSHLNYAILLVDYMNKPKEGLAMATKVKFLESERKDVLDRAFELEKKARSGIK